ncbi:SPARC-like isoform X2 [Clavelina lepadiformis]|uniref:SPARC-like isoform X2 n=1 Tax=Clavelina lepadiformis TaxID=159417 RepID=UPI0040424440
MKLLIAILLGVVVFACAKAAQKDEFDIIQPGVRNIHEANEPDPTTQEDDFDVNEERDENIEIQEIEEEQEDDETLIDEQDEEEEELGGDEEEPYDDGEEIAEENDDNEEADMDDNDEESEDEDELTEAELIDPCKNVQCKPGRECVVTATKEAKCRCMSECPQTESEHEKVCANNNVTYASECDLYRTKCLAKHDNVEWGKHLKVEYYGPCKELSPCGDVELSEFPTRMRSWLKNLYLQLFDMEEEFGGLSDEQRNHGRRLVANRVRVEEFERQTVEEMSRELEQFYPLYVYPVHWKFSTLDVDPKDSYLSKRELEPMSAALIPFEHCAKDFLKKMDANRDHHISIYEWGEAMGIKEDDMGPSLLARGLTEM